jgi:hypothetical protein
MGSPPFCWGKEVHPSTLPGLAGLPKSKPDTSRNPVECTERVPDYLILGDSELSTRFPD